MQHTQPRTCTVAIPLYKEIPTPIECESLRQCARCLGMRKLRFFCPEGLNIARYTAVLQEFDIASSVHFFHKSFFSGTKGYSALLMQPQFFQAFADSDYLLIYQLDAWIFRDELDLWCAKGYDYIGAPWLENFAQQGNLWAVGNGGFSLRNVKSSLAFLHRFEELRAQVQTSPALLATLFPENPSFQHFLHLFLKCSPHRSEEWNQLPNEDGFWGLIAPALANNFKVPSPTEALQFSFECAPEFLYELNGHQLPMGCHAFEKYNPAFWRQFISALPGETISHLESTMHFTVATSIAPKGLELQRKAIASWQKLGFQVLSFNNAAEVAQLAPQFPDVRFITVSRDGTARSGKPLVYVQDMLAWFRDNLEVRYGGFINSDIVVQPADPEGFLALLQREITSSLIFSRRIEVKDIGVLDGKWNRTGIDLWLWDREILHCYTEPADYMVGFPHWDYYMELLPICHGIPVKQLAIPNAYHQTHDAYYDWVRDAVPFALTTFKLIYPFLDRIPDKDHLLLPTINYCFKHQPAEIRTQDDLEFLAMFLNTLDKFFLETIDRCSLKLNYVDIPHVPEDQRLSLCHNPAAYQQPTPKAVTLPVTSTSAPLPRITLGTSLSPRDFAKQKLAVASWIAHGFDPVSFNCAREVAEMQSLYPEVRFVTIHRDGTALAGRPLLYIDDMIHWFRDSGLPCGGFINADIIIKPSQPEVFNRLVHEQISGSMLFARRIEISSTQALDTFWQTLQGGWVRSGIDLWLFDCAILSRYKFTTDYLVGFPHWDYFMCLWPLPQGCTLRELAIPCIFHIEHPAQYSFENQMNYAIKTYLLLQPLLPRFMILERSLLAFIDFLATQQPDSSVNKEAKAKYYEAFRYALDLFFLETIFANCKRVSYAHVAGAQDDVVPGYNHALHSFGTLEIVLHKTGT